MINLINLCMGRNIEKFIYFQTALCYGLSPQENPIRLSHPYFSGSSDCVNSSYSISKTTAELYLRMSGIPFLSYRLANAYGSRNVSGALPSIYYKIKSNSDIIINNTRRDFIYIDDLVRCVLSGFNSDKIGFYHISTGKDYSIKELFLTLIEVMGIEAPKNVIYKERGIEDVESILIDPSKTKNDFNWDAKTELKYGITQAVKWYEKNENLQTFTHLTIK